MKHLSPFDAAVLLAVFLLLLPLIAWPVSATANTTTASSDAALPAEFISLAPKRMNWVDAAAYCRQQGGRLPRINNSDSAAGDEFWETIDGFGSQGAPWPQMLPGGAIFYWTGTELADNPGYSFLVGNYGGKVFITCLKQDYMGRVVCVP